MERIPSIDKRVLVVVIAIPILILGCMSLFGSRSGIYSKNKQATIAGINELRSLQWIPIEWDSSESSDRSAMMLRVYIDTIVKPFLFQFDLGTPFSSVFRLSEYFPYLKQKELRNELTLDGKRTDVYSGLTMRLGDSLFYLGEKIPIYEYESFDSLSEKSGCYSNKAGDLGYDLIENRILIIDFKKSRLAILDSLPSIFSSSIEYFDSALISNDPIFLPIEIKGVKKLMQYDNGSSAFTLITDTVAWNQWRDHSATIDTFIGWSWGQPVHFLRSSAGVRIHFMNNDYSHKPIWAEEGRKPASYPDTHTGDIGDEYFRNEVILFDAKHNLFGRFKTLP